MREPLVRFALKASDSVPNDEDIDRALAPFNIRNKESFMRRHDEWMGKYMSTTEEDLWKESDVWEVTLFINTGRCEIHWEAIERNSGEHKSELLYGDSKVLLNGSVEEAEDTVREAIEGDVVSKLVHVSNLDDVLRKQVPAMIQELRQQES